MKAKAKPILRLLLLIFLGLALGFNFYLLNAKVMVGNQMPMPFGIGAAVVQSGSMEPTYSKGDLLFVKAQAHYAPGDIVVYQSQGTLVVHRIVSLSGDTVVTKGDANNTTDQPFSAAQIKGAVAGRIPVAGYAIDFLKTPFGILLLLGGAVLLVELSFRRDRSNEQEDEKDQNIRLLQEEIQKIRRELEDFDKK